MGGFRGRWINLASYNACFLDAYFEMPNFGLFRTNQLLNAAIVRAGPIRSVMTLAWIKRDLTVLHAFQLEACDSFEFFRNRTDLL